MRREAKALLEPVRHLQLNTVKPLKAVVREHRQLRESQAQRSQLTQQPLADAIAALDHLAQQAHLVADPLGAEPGPGSSVLVDFLHGRPGRASNGAAAEAAQPIQAVPPHGAEPAQADLPRSAEPALEACPRRATQRKSAPRRKRPALGAVWPAGGAANLLEQPINWDSFEAMLEEDDHQRFAEGLAEGLASCTGVGLDDDVLTGWLTTLSHDAAVAPFLEAIVALPESPCVAAANAPGAAEPSADAGPAEQPIAGATLGGELPPDLESKLAMLDYG